MAAAGQTSFLVPKLQDEGMPAFFGTQPVMTLGSEEKGEGTKKAELSYITTKTVCNKIATSI